MLPGGHAAHRRASQGVEQLDGWIARCEADLLILGGSMVLHVACGVRGAPSKPDDSLRLCAEANPLVEWLPCGRCTQKEACGPTFGVIADRVIEQRPTGALALMSFCRSHRPDTNRCVHPRGLNAADCLILVPCNEHI